MDQEQQLSYLMERKLQLLVEMHTKKYEKEITSLKEQLASVMTQLETMQTNVKGLRQDVSLPPSQKLPEQSPRQEIQLNLQRQPILDTPSIPLNDGGQQQQLPRSTPADSSVTSQKCGEYTPDDVSVEKFFYFGAK